MTMRQSAGDDRNLKRTLNLCQEYGVTQHKLYTVVRSAATGSEGIKSVAYVFLEKLGLSPVHIFDLISRVEGASEGGVDVKEETELDVDEIMIYGDAETASIAGAEGTEEEPIRAEVKSERAGDAGGKGPEATGRGTEDERDDDQSTVRSAGETYECGLGKCMAKLGSHRTLTKQ